MRKWFNTSVDNSMSSASIAGGRAAPPRRRAWGRAAALKLYSVKPSSPATLDPCLFVLRWEGGRCTLSSKIYGLEEAVVQRSDGGRLVQPISRDSKSTDRGAARTYDEINIEDTFVLHAQMSNCSSQPTVSGSSPGIPCVWAAAGPFLSVKLSI